MKLKYIDALRGLAILGVVVVNTASYGHSKYPELIQALINQGERGVQLFFVVSAFTLFLSYHHRLDQGTTATRNFFLRRFFRIAPLYYLAILYFLWQDGFGPRYWLGDEPFVTPWNILSNFLFMHGIHPSWITSVVPGGLVDHSRNDVLSIGTQPDRKNKKFKSSGSFHPWHPSALTNNKSLAPINFRSSKI